MINRPWLLVLATITTVAVSEETPPAKAPEGTEYRVLKKIELGGESFWDLLAYDSSASRLYISRSNRVMVVDMEKEKLAGEVTGIKGSHGVAIVPEANLGFATSGKDNTVRIFDLKTLKETSQVKTGSKPDAILYDPSSKKVFAFNNGGTTATVIDTETCKLAGEVELGGAPE